MENVTEKNINEEGKVIFRTGHTDLVIGLSKRFRRDDEDGRNIYFPKVSFKGNVYEIRPNDTVQHRGEDFPTNSIIRILRDSRGNQKNGGESFWEETAAERAILKTGGFYAQIPDDGFNETDIEYLDFMDRVKDKMAPPQKDQVFERADHLFDRMHVLNAKRPNKYYNMKRMKAWITSFLLDLEAVGITLELAKDSIKKED